MYAPKDTAELFRLNGAKIIADESIFLQKMAGVKALVFDWDGVFNEGWKGENVLSPFSEIDSMGINMLRFALWLKTGNLPHVFIVSGLKNLSAQVIAQREHFTALYLETLHKSNAIEHIFKHYGIHSKEMICFFDDILDVPMAKDCALRILIHRKSNPLFEQYAIENRICDYVTATESGKPAIRESCEFLLGITGWYDQTISKRIDFSSEYVDFLNHRKERIPVTYRYHENTIQEYKA
ncbi:MAG TPA: phosphatase [Cytophagales bacterium]|jgi:3-deoxy-D-manno-octulosonate 8-phosphate phosphatase (KDO 8-P phosphatase)|nr:phosphatase [Cytophagales bacterium]